MVDVVRYHVGDEFVTDVLAAKKNFLAKLRKASKKKKLEVARLVALIRRAAEVGFDLVPENVIRHELDGVHAMGDRQGPKQRGAGFYDEKASKQCFLLMEYYEKRGQANTQAQNAMLRRIAKVRRTHDWRLADDE